MNFNPQGGLNERKLFMAKGQCKYNKQSMLYKICELTGNECSGIDCDNYEEQEDNDKAEEKG